MIDQEKEKVVIVALSLPGRTGWEVDDRLDELEQLLLTAGASIVSRVVQNRSEPDHAYLVGKGKAHEIEQIRADRGAGTVVFDAELSPSQRRNLEDVIECKVIDRTQVILDIFAQRARTREGKLQVEMAQLTYSLTQLVGSREELSRLGGGIGTRGPGETKLEVDRRRIRQRIRDTRQNLESVRQHRALGRAERRQTPVVVAALVGYTNAGKSTLLNNLTGATVLVEDRLFATLDPTTRRARLPSGQEILFTDTVGFIRDLPHHLVAAFRATLEEVTEADLIVHVVDANSPVADKQIEVVDRVLADLGVAAAPQVVALNKTDLGFRVRLPDDRPWVAISALKSEGLDKLLESIDSVLSSGRQLISLEIPYSMQSLISSLHEHGRVISTDYGNDAIVVQAELNSVWAKRFLGWAKQAREDRIDGCQDG
jgi:GTP-binding protein HflX